MKKKLLLVLVIALTLFLTGCGKGNKTLTCAKLNKGYTIDENNTVEISFKNDKATKYKLISVAVLPDDQVTYIDEYKTRFKDAYQPFEDMGGKVKVTSEDSEMKLTVELDVTKLSKDQLDGINGGEVLTYNYEKAKKQLTKDGYKCKK